ncbi:MAG: hypothetical protein K2Q01_12600 [Rickettsiales bacterium]|nr:hypothetical protein [Rickettsiales bacterium]
MPGFDPNNPDFSPGQAMGQGAATGGMPVPVQGMIGPNGQPSTGQLPNSTAKLISTGKINTIMPNGQADTKQAYTFEFQLAPGQTALMPVTGRLSGQYLVIDSIFGAPLVATTGKPSGRIILDLSNPATIGPNLEKIRQNPGAFINDIEQLPRNGLNPMLPDGTLLPADPALLPNNQPAGNVIGANLALPANAAHHTHQQGTSTT